LAGGTAPATWASLANGPGKPLINKAITGVYPPGSTFKPAVALAGLESGKIGPNNRISCGGSFWFGGRAFRCWRKGGHGGLNIVQALEQSCDVFFYSVGNWVGIDRIATYAKMLGLGMATGIDLPGERTGTIPSTAWKKRVLKVKWYPGETISCAIGQGYVTVTPLQLALFTSGLAHGQRIIAPRIGKAVRNPDTGAQAQKIERPERELTLSPKSLSLVQEGLLAVVEGPRGTGKRAIIPNLRVAGKTGTAQVVKLSTFKGYSPSAIPERYRDHAWFIAFAPYEHPKIAVAVLVEHGEHGATTAAPVAKAMIEAYLRLVPNPLSGGMHGTARSNP
jgi:penicillin-binding protein 2